MSNKYQINHLVQKVRLLTIFAICFTITFSCHNEKEAGDDLLVEMGKNFEQLKSLNLKGTQWKFEGIYSSEPQKLTAPDESEECYTLTFSSDVHAASRESCQITYHVMEISETKILCGSDSFWPETGFWAEFMEKWYNVNSYSVSTSEMRLYTTETDYLLYKKLKK